MTNLYSLEKGAGNKAIILVHGNSSNAQSWLPQLSDSHLQERYRLIAVDLPGCGASPRTGDYSLETLKEAVLQFIQQLNVEEYILVGLSYGSNIVGEIAQHLPNGCKGFFIVSSNLTNDAHPPQSFTQSVAPLQALAAPIVPDDAIEAFARLLFYNQESSFIHDFVESYKNTDPVFRTAIGTAIVNSAWTDEWHNITHTNLPCCFVFGQEEQVIDIHYVDDFPAKWRDQVFYIPGSAHYPNLEQPEKFNMLLREFAEDVF